MRDTMLQIQNDTPFRAALAPMADEQGIDALYVCVKGTWTLRPSPTLADAQRPIVTGDVHLGEPGKSSLLEAGEHHLGKAGTDVVLQGCARPQDGRAAANVAVSVSVAERSKSIMVWGDRQWRALDRVSAAQPFTEMPLVYERALGGVAVGGDRSARDLSAHNPVGVGIDRRAGLPVPNLEDPRAPIEGGGGAPRAVGFGAIAPGWEPRVRFAGTYDAAWTRRRAPLLPTDFNRRFFNFAAPELTFDRFLDGGEPVVVLGASRLGPLQFNLPRPGLVVQGRIAGAWRNSQVQLETVALWPEIDALTLTWRAKFSCDRTLLQAERVHITFAHAHEGTP